MANKQKLSTTINDSIITKLRDQNKLNDNTLILISNLSIEDLLAVKLELSANHMKNRLYGFNLWQKSQNIFKEALLKFAISHTQSKKDAARFLGLTYNDFKKAFNRYDVADYFKEKEV